MIAGNVVDCSDATCIVVLFENGIELVHTVLVLVLVLVAAVDVAVASVRQFVIENVRTGE